MTPSARVFVNEGSGASSCDSEQIARLFQSHGWTCECTRLQVGVDIKRLARNDRADIVFVAAGGDGTINAVASAVAGSARAMGVLPVGTLNHFAHDLGLPMDLESAVSAIAGGDRRSVDVAEVNGQIFVNNSSIGVYPMMVLDRERMKKSGLNKWASLVWASTKSFVRFRCLTITLEVEGQTRRCRTPLLFVGNNEYVVEGTKLGARNRLDSGKLAVYLVPGASRSTILRMAFAAFFGRLKSMPEYEEFHVEQLTVSTSKRKLRVSLDGEVRRMRGPLDYRIRPLALHVCVPAPEPR